MAAKSGRRRYVIEVDADVVLAEEEFERVRAYAEDAVRRWEDGELLVLFLGPGLHLKVVDPTPSEERSRFRAMVLEAKDGFDHPQAQIACDFILDLLTEREGELVEVKRSTQVRAEGPPT